MKQVSGNVFIGDKEDALQCVADVQEIKWILTIDSEPLHSTKQNEDLVMKHVECMDVPEADLLSHFDECIEFIQQGLKKSKVLVHCSAGISRSATVVLAFMMQKQNIGLNKVLEDLKALYRKADPNPGFLYQLQLFQAMGCKVDLSHSLYKQFKLQMFAKELEKNGSHQLPHQVLKHLTHEPRISLVESKEIRYKCRKCSYQLFEGTNCLQHKPGSGREFLPWYNKSLIQEEQKSERNICTSYFIEPVKWMMPLLTGTTEGKLCCPKCSGRIGSFNWAGEQCSCGRWVTPAFQIHKSRLDER